VRPEVSHVPSPDAEQRAAEVLHRARELDTRPLPPDVRVRIRAGIERRLAEQPSRRGWAWALAVLGGCSAAAAILVAVPHLGKDSARLAVLSKGEVLLEAQGGARALHAGDELPIGGTLSATAGAATLTISRAAVATLTASTRFRIVSVRQAEVVEGSVRFQVSPHPAHAPFVVSAGEVSVQVIGTEFEVARVGGEVGVRVLEGVVRVESSNLSVRVAAGESWSSAQAPSPASSPVAPPEPEIAEPKAISDTDGLLQRAARLTREGRADDAALIYRDLADRGGQSGELALYLLARLQAQRLGRHGDALASLAEMERRFPHGQLDYERRVSRIEALRALGRQGEAREAERDFDRTYRSTPGESGSGPAGRDE